MGSYGTPATRPTAARDGRFISPGGLGYDLEKKTGDPAIAGED